ncbi:hypothetical protein AF79_04940 [Aliarcobacter butzleri L354]|uniref:hypothetical protein n=1 Tax=Aliarcobacter butzleri TaxID=28197 RepID=UPI00063AD479|nr:hypothetical protein [Aliarcobacter butzleri]KLE09841.1 hypothetical protein AF79_04940 [Aliarcobacter butzleri L354]
MFRLLQIAFITILTVFLFSGCASNSMQGKIFSLNPDTLTDAKKNISFEVSNVKLDKDLPNYHMHGFIIEEDNIKKSLQENLDKFYPKNSKIVPYKVELFIEFEKDAYLMNVNIVKTNGVYKIYKNENLIKTINIKSEYQKKTKNKKDKLYSDSALYGVDDRLYNIPEFRKKYLEYTAYVLDKEIAGDQQYFNHYLYFYAGAIRLSFAKFIQELNNLEIK